MLVIAKSADDLQALLNILNMLAVKIRLKFNPRKCKTLHYSSKPPAGCRNTTFHLDGIEIPIISDGDTAIFLDKPVGAFMPKDLVTIQQLKSRAVKILTSKLTPWQRIDCIKSFLPILAVSDED